MKTIPYSHRSTEPGRRGCRKAFSVGAWLLLASLWLPARSAEAADAAWSSSASGSWNSGTNWSSGAAPGATSGTANTDTATFGAAATAAETITVDTGRNIFGLDFSGNTFGYTLSSGSLLLTSGGEIQSSGSTASITDAISAPITLEGDGGGYTFLSGASVSTNILSISGSITGASSSDSVTTLTLSGSNTGSNVLSGVLGDGSAGGQLALVKTGSGTWALSGTTNTFTGPVTIDAGTLSTTGTGALDASNVVTIASGATFSTSVNITLAGLDDGTGGGGAVTNSGAGSRTLTLRGAGDYSFSGQVGNGTGTTSLTMAGTGTQVLSGSNTFTGIVTLSSGILDLNFGASGAPASNILFNGVTPGTLTMGGGTLLLNGSTGTANSQTVAKITLTAGASTVDLTAGASEPLLFSFGTISTRAAGGTVNFILPANSQSATNGILTTMANTNGIIGGYATVGGADWAVSGAASASSAYTAAASGGAFTFAGSLANGTAVSLAGSLSGSSTAVSAGELLYVVGYNSANSTYELALTPNGTALTNTGTSATSGTATVSTQGDVAALASYSSFTGSSDSSTGNFLLTGAGTLASTETINSLKITTTAASQALSLGSGTLTLTSGGLLFVGANNYQITGGTLKGGNTDLVVQQYGTGSLTIGSAIGGTGALTLSGTGTLIITSANSYTGGTFLNGGILDFNGTNALGSSTGGVTFNGGTLQYAAGSTVDISGRTLAFNADGATIDTNGNNVTFANAVGGSGTGSFTKAGLGKLTLEGVNTYTGNTTVTAGTLLLSGSGSIAGSPLIDVKSGAIFDVSLTTAQTVLGTTQTLMGAGTINGPVTVSGGLTPGESGSVGTLTFNDSLTFDATSHVLLTLNSASSYSQIVVGGSQAGVLTEGGGTLTLSLTLGSLSDTSYTLFSLLNGSTASGDFGAVYLDGNAFTFNNGNDTWSYLDSSNAQEYIFADNTGILNLEAVPEPPAWTLLLAGLGVFLAMKNLRACEKGRLRGNRQAV